MLSLVLAVAVLAADPKPVPGADYYREAVEVLDAAKNEKAFAAAVAKLNKKWAKKRIVVEFQITGHPDTQMFYSLNAMEKQGDWMPRCMRAWLPPGPLPKIGNTLIFTGSPEIGGKKETAFGTLHAGGQSIPFQLVRHTISRQD